MISLIFLFSSSFSFLLFLFCHHFLRVLNIAFMCYVYSTLYYYYYIQVLRPYASLWAYDRRASDETMYKILIYIHKTCGEKHIKEFLNVCTPNIDLFVQSYLVYGFLS